MYHMLCTYLHICVVLIRELDESLLRNIANISYEDKVLHLPSGPDVGHYLAFEVFIFYPICWKFELCRFLIYHLHNYLIL